LTSGGYPASYEKGRIIEGLDKIKGTDDIFIFHAGTKIADNHSVSGTRFLTNGGRVLNIAALASTFKEAQSKAYRAIDNIKFDKMHYRKDIGDKALNFNI